MGSRALAFFRGLVGAGSMVARRMGHRRASEKRRLRYIVWSAICLVDGGLWRERMTNIAEKTYVG